MFNKVSLVLGKSKLLTTLVFLGAFVCLFTAMPTTAKAQSAPTSVVNSINSYCLSFPVGAPLVGLPYWETPAMVPGQDTLTIVIRARMQLCSGSLMTSGSTSSNPIFSSTGKTTEIQETGYSLIETIPLAGCTGSVTSIRSDFNNAIGLGMYQSFGFLASGSVVEQTIGTITFSGLSACPNASPSMMLGGTVCFTRSYNGSVASPVNGLLCNNVTYGPTNVYFGATRTPHTLSFNTPPAVTTPPPVPPSTVDFLGLRCDLVYGQVASLAGTIVTINFWEYSGTSYGSTTALADASGNFSQSTFARSTEGKSFYAEVPFVIASLGVGPCGGGPIITPPPPPSGCGVYPIVSPTGSLIGGPYYPCPAEIKLYYDCRSVLHGFESVLYIEQINGAISAYTITGPGVNIRTAPTGNPTVVILPKGTIGRLTVQVDTSAPWSYAPVFATIDVDCYPPPVGFIDDCIGVTGGINFKGWAYAPRNPSGPNPTVTITVTDWGPAVPAFDAFMGGIGRTNYLTPKLRPTWLMRGWLAPSASSTPIFGYHVLDSGFSPGSYYYDTYLSSVETFLDYNPSTTMTRARILQLLNAGYAWNPYFGVPPPTATEITQGIALSNAFLAWADDIRAVYNETTTFVWPGIWQTVTTIDYSSPRFPASLKADFEAYKSAKRNDIPSVIWAMTVTGFIQTDKTGLWGGSAVPLPVTTIPTYQVTVPTDIDYRQAQVLAYLGTLSPSLSTFGGDTFGYEATVTLPSTRSLDLYVSGVTNDSSGAIGPLSISSSFMVSSVGYNNIWFMPQGGGKIPVSCNTVTNPEPLGFIDYCTLSGNRTTLYGWAFDANGAENSPDPTVTVRAGSANQVFNTDRDYNTAGIKTYLTGRGYITSASDGLYGFAATFDDLWNTQPYTVSGVVNNVGPGSSQNLGINAAPSTVANQYTFASGLIPSNCLVKPYRLQVTTNQPSTIDTGTTTIVGISHRIFNNQFGTNLSQADSPAVNSIVNLYVRKLGGPVINISPYPDPVVINALALNTDQNIIRGGIDAGVLDAGDRVCTNITVFPYSNYPSDPLSITTVEQCALIANKPYLKILGDIRAGTSVRGWNRGLPNYQFGASASGSILADTEAISGFVSGVFRTKSTASTTSIPKNLSLSNTVVSTGPYPTATEYGGLFNSGLTYTGPSSFVDTTTPATPVSGSIDLSAAASSINVLRASLGVTVTLSSIARGQKTILYVNGDVVINDNITYANAAGYVTLADIPSLRIIASGNIFIAPGVTELSGLYVAQGSLYTCHDGTWGTPITSRVVDANGNVLTPGIDLFTACNKPLAVYGALVSNSLKLTRTKGSLRTATANDGKVVSGAITNQGNIAETIIAGPEYYLATPAGTAYRPVGSTSDSVTALPPLF